MDTAKHIDTQDHRPGRLYWGNLNWLWLSLIVIGTDWATKWAATHFLTFATPEAITPFFNLTLLYNHGAAFSLLAQASGWQRWGFATLAVLIAGGLLVWLLRIPGRQAIVPKRRGLILIKFAIALIIGGAIGNLIDRVLIGYVVDFLDFHAFGYHWPAFNVADSAITIGVILLLVVEILPAKTPSRAQGARSS
ncbi:signal peptidase II [Halothiobacillus diazotrophicus]|uniref:Lipoprotein signal peptidase n=1 Tax=Halothiobacillus diazotrophicus TaxID=1860122 RepID=A0A191ZIB8_9GAMM|nr:signal peptidase II [Halothiobacillus diazotrophicus]ANJ67597.1 signal peptidase II [Halothiobacillus diazotrophicus]